MDMLKRRHIRFKPKNKNEITISVKYIDSFNSTISYCIKGYIYDISLGEMGILLKQNSFKRGISIHKFFKGEKIDLYLKNYGHIKNAVVIRTEKEFIGTRFDMNEANNGIVLEFIKNNLTNFK